MQHLGLVLQMLPFECILGYLQGVDLVSFIRLNRDYHTICQEEEEGKLNLWLELCKRRWNLTSFRPTRYGCRTWCEVYGQLNQSMRLPKGKFSTPHQRVMGKSFWRGTGMHVWLCLDHFSDCRLQRLHIHGEEYRAVRLRLVVQNLRYSSVVVGPAQYQLQAHLVGGRQLKTLPAVEAAIPKVIALNGREAPDNTQVELGPLDFAVVLHIIAAPLDCDYETDFLECCDAIDLHFNSVYGPNTRSQQCSRSGCDSTPNANCVKVRVKLIDSEVIWNYYKFLPGGCVYLSPSDLFSNA